jgi:hypothetical protein
VGAFPSGRCADCKCWLTNEPLQESGWDANGDWSVYTVPGFFGCDEIGKMIYPNRRHYTPKGFGCVTFEKKEPPCTAP